MRLSLLLSLVELIATLIRKAPVELLKKFADSLLDFVEEFVLGTASTIDDQLVLPVCAKIREAFNIPDND